MKGKLIFVVPLAKNEMVSSWEETLRMFQRTTRSASKQISRRFEILVIGHTKPSVGLDRENLTFFQVDFPLELSLKDRPEMPKEELREIKWTDMGRKRLFGLVKAIERGATHVMFLDGDDCVSNRLASLVESSPNAPGWFFETGYRYNEGENHVRFKPRKFHQECNSSSILRVDLLPVPEHPEYDRGFDYYRFYINHQFLLEKMKKLTHCLKKLNFPGAIYVIHGANLHAQKHQQKNIHFVREWLTNLLFRHPITKSFSNEFSLE